MKYVLFASKVAVSAGLLFFALRTVDLSVVEERLVGLDPAWLGVAVAIFMAQVVVASFRWFWVLRGLRETADTGKLIRFSAIATFFNQTLPSTIGGDAVRLWLLQRHGASLRIATHSVLLDRFFGLLALVGLIILLLPWSLEAITDANGRQALMYLVVVALVGIAMFFALGGRIDGWMGRFRPVALLSRLARDARSVAVSGQSGVPVALMSVAVHGMTVLGVLALGMSLGLELGLLPVLLVVPPVMLIITLPISIAGWGVRESAMIVAFGYTGLAEESALALSILFGLVFLVVGVVGGLVWLAGDAERIAAPAIHPSVE